MELCSKQQNNFEDWKIGERLGMLYYEIQFVTNIQDTDENNNLGCDIFLATDKNIDETGTANYRCRNASI